MAGKSLYSEYDSCFGDGLGTGDYLQMSLEEEAKKGRSTKKKSRKNIPTVVTGIDLEEDQNQYSIRTEFFDQILNNDVANEMRIIEQIIPRELQEIDAGRFLNENLEQHYKEMFDEEAGNLTNTSCHVQIPAPVESSTPIVSSGRKKKTKGNNALVESLKKNGMIKNEASDSSLTSSVSSDSSQDFQTAHTSAEDSYLTAGSTESSFKETPRVRRSTSKRFANMSKLKVSNIESAPKTVKSRPSDPRVSVKHEKKKSSPPYVPVNCKYDFDYKEEDFPALKKY